VSSSLSTQWQIPVGLQLVPGAVMGLGMLLVKESVRWLAKRGRNDEAYASLLWVRGGEESAEITQEFQEILAGVQLEIQQTEGLTYKELLLPSNRLRLFIAITIQLCQQVRYHPRALETISRCGDAPQNPTGNTTMTYRLTCVPHHSS
jgi:hypothetical protein